QKLAIILEDEALLIDQFKQNSGRLQLKDELEEIIAAKIKMKSRAEWKELLDEAGIPNGPINNVKEALDSQQALAREMVVKVEHPTIPNLKLIGSPLKFSKTPITLNTHPPMHSEHTEEVLLKLGYSKQEIIKLKEEKII
ncbi:MAG: CoA transferase, partial [Bacillus sp. (in: firmicutes)]